MLQLILFFLIKFLLLFDFSQIDSSLIESTSLSLALVCIFELKRNRFDFFNLFLAKYFYFRSYLKKERK